MHIMADSTGSLRSSEVAAASGEGEAAVRCLLMPFHGFNVLIPNTAVAEVIAYEKPQGIEQGPVWLKGLVTWRGKSVPVVSLEKMVGANEGTPAAQARLIIFNSLGEATLLPFIAMVAQGIPRLLALRASNLHHVPGEFKVETGVYARLLVDGNPVVVPDLERVEKMLIQIGLPRGK